MHAVDLRGETPLHEAAGAGHVPVTMTLLSGRANPNIANLDMETPLLRAARRGYTGVVEVCPHSHSSHHTFVVISGHTAVAEIQCRLV